MRARSRIAMGLSWNLSLIFLIVLVEAQRPHPADPAENRYRMAHRDEGVLLDVAGDSRVGVIVRGHGHRRLPRTNRSDSSAVDSSAGLVSGVAARRRLREHPGARNARRMSAPNGLEWIGNDRSHRRVGSFIRRH